MVAVALEAQGKPADRSTYLVSMSAAPSYIDLKNERWNVRAVAAFIASTLTGNHKCPDLLTPHLTSWHKCPDLGHPNWIHIGQGSLAPTTRRQEMGWGASNNVCQRRTEGRWGHRAAALVGDGEAQREASVTA